MGWVKDYVTAGMTCLDVGANAGLYTMAMQEQGARVWAIDPDPRCRPALLVNLPADQVLTVAVGETVGETTLYRSRRAAHNSLFAANIIEAHETVPDMTVPITTLDTLQAEGRIPAHIDVIKIDVQGAELAVLRGAERLLTTQHPWLYVELWPAGLAAAGTSVPAVRAFCEALGYQSRDPRRPWAWFEHHCAQNCTGHSSCDVLLVPATVAVPA